MFYFVNDEKYLKNYRSENIVFVTIVLKTMVLKTIVNFENDSFGMKTIVLE